jgi:hypothetical protein
MEWSHPERAHIVSQPVAGMHMRTHLAMLGYRLRHRDRREIAGQMLRLTVAAPGSRTGRHPVGNTGGADVSALLPMFIPDDLRQLLEGAAAGGAGVPLTSSVQGRRARRRSAVR